MIEVVVGFIITVSIMNLILVGSLIYVVKQFNNMKTAFDDILLKIMKDHKTELLTDGNNIYTICGDSIALLENGRKWLLKAVIVWNQAKEDGRAEVYQWENKKEYVEDVSPLELKLFF